MGIDPRSLGLGGPDSGRSASGSATPGDGLGDGLDDGFDGGAAVLPLRPEFRQHPDQPPQSAPEQPVVVPAVVPPVPLPAQRPDTGRLLRSVARGLVTPDGAVAMQDERALVESVRTRQADRRIVTFVAGKGGVGCTTVAVAVGTTFVALREDRSVVVDVQQGTASLGSLLGAEHPTRVGELLVRHEVVEAPRAPSGLGVVDGADWDLGLSRSDVGGVLERLGRETTFNLLDAGDEAGEGAHTALARADQVVVVTGPGEVGAAALGSVVERVRRVNPAAAERLVTVVVCPDEESHRRTVRELGPASGVPASGPVVVVPPEPALRAGAPYDAAHVSGATREAVLRVAAHVATPDGPSGR
ncbi:MAG TPA: hypothetical protein VFO98_07495 [Marmoricola sp.]|jgi:MinD-like ATPase involved in chromosome partitioning or flagellar assembly|nr:hypothetical protein [Marmoricola sp.]